MDQMVQRVSTTNYYTCILTCEGKVQEIKEHRNISIQEHITHLKISQTSVQISEKADYDQDNTREHPESWEISLLQLHDFE